MYFNYHARLRELLNTEPYIIEPASDPFCMRFNFPQFNKSYPIRPYRLDEYRKYWEGNI